MKWYRIPPCPNYAISEDGVEIKNIRDNRILKHNTSSFAKDSLRRVTLRHNITNHMNKVRSVTAVFTLNSLKKYIKPENLIKGTDPDGGVIGEPGEDGSKFIK